MNPTPSSLLRDLRSSGSLSRPAPPPGFAPFAMSDNDLPSHDAMEAIFKLALDDPESLPAHHGGFGYPSPPFPNYPAHMLPGQPPLMMMPGQPPMPVPTMNFAAPGAGGVGMYSPMHTPGLPPPGTFMLPQLQLQPRLAAPQHPRLPDFARMTGKEVARIASAQAKGVETGDEFADDFYNIQLTERRTHAAPASDLAGDTSNEDRPAEVLNFLKKIHRGEHVEPSALALARSGAPLPLGNLRAAEMQERARSLAQHSQAWADSNQVLGRMAKSSIRTPRELIVLQENIVPKDEGSSFASATWKLRNDVAEVTRLLDAIADKNALLKARAAALPRGPVPEAMNQGMAPLEAEQRALCASLGARLGLDSSSDEALVGLLWLPRGRKAVLRALRCLLPEHHLLLLQAAARMLVFFVCTAPDGRNSADAVMQEKGALDATAARALVREFGQLPLDALGRCLELLLASQTPESLRAVLATPGGAEVVRNVLMRGQALADAQPGSRLQQDWQAGFAKFIHMAEQGIQAKEAR